MCVWGGVDVRRRGGESEWDVVALPERASGTSSPSPRWVPAAAVARRQGRQATRLPGNEVAGRQGRSPSAGRCVPARKENKVAGRTSTSLAVARTRATPKAAVGGRDGDVDVVVASLDAVVVQAPKVLAVRPTCRSGLRAARPVAERRDVDVLLLGRQRRRRGRAGGGRRRAQGVAAHDAAGPGRPGPVLSMRWLPNCPRRRLGLGGRPVCTRCGRHGALWKFVPTALVVRPEDAHEQGVRPGRDAPVFPPDDGGKPEDRRKRDELLMVHQHEPLCKSPRPLGGATGGGCAGRRGAAVHHRPGPSGVGGWV